MVEPREWLIRKGGYYYRPNCSGYTTSKFEAGRYTKSEAEREAAVEPWHMKAVHQDDVEDDPVSSRVRVDSARIAELEAEVERLTKERDKARAANERDRTEVIVAVNAIADAFARRDWLIRGGRGSYEWDDDRFRDEFRDAMAEFEPHVDRLRKIGADRTNCPETQAEIIAARAALSERAGGVKVKTLKWEGRDGDWLARPTSGPYYLIQKFHTGWDLLIDGHYVRPYIAGVRETYTLAEAKAAAQADYERRIRSALTTEPAAPEGEQEAVAEFGNGEVLVDTGTFRGRPAVFVRPAPAPGPVGQLAPAAIRSEGLLEVLPGEWFVTFPTDEQACAVANALVGKFTRPAEQAVTGWLPINAAPKDGTWFVARQGGETYPCQWHTEEPDEGPGYEGWYDLFNRSFEAPTEWCAAHPPAQTVTEAIPVIEELKFALFSNDLTIKDRADQTARLFLSAALARKEGKP